MTKVMDSNSKGSNQVMPWTENHHTPATLPVVTKTRLKIDRTCSSSMRRKRPLAGRPMTIVGGHRRSAAGYVSMCP